MVSPTVGSVVTFVVLAVFAWVGFRVRAGELDVEEYMIARNSQTAGTLALSFLASGMGVWILFAPPEVGAFVGIVAVVGYAVAAATPVVLFGLLGRRMRAAVPAGHSLTEFVRVRYGRAFHALVVVVSVAYMLLFLTAELTAVGTVAEILTGTDPRVAVVAVAAVTLAYTAYGGLRASLRTDRWQAWLLLALLALVAVALAAAAPAGSGELAATGLFAVDTAGVEAAAALVIAVTVANLFHQGYWQRVWAAAEPRTLVAGAWGGAVVILPAVLLVGLTGIVARAAGLDLGEPPAPAFALLAELPSWTALVVLVLAVALVASSVDTLENGLASVATAERPTLSLGAARTVTAVLLVPAVAVALQGFSVLRLFLIADVLCAAIVVPTLLGLWSRATTQAALAGGLAGIAGTVVPGWVATGSLAHGASLATFPDAVPTLAPFAGALGISAIVTLAVSVGQRRTTDVAAVGAQIADRAAARRGGDPQ